MDSKRRNRHLDYSVVFLGICLLADKGVICLQKFEKQPTYSEVNPGDDIKLDCKILDKKGTCSWQKDNKPVGIYARKYEWASGKAGEREGECSLWVRAATLEFDDGEWECQVTASDFTTQDALTSTPVRLVVRVAPQRPRIEHRGAQVLPAHNVTVRAGVLSHIKCLSRYGNPPPLIKWILDDKDVTSSSNQTNSPETDNPRTWLAVSVLNLTLAKDRNGRSLQCIALHESYTSRSMTVDARIDVTYPPEVRLLGAPSGDVEEGQEVRMRCATDANPLAAVAWRRLGQAEVSSLDEKLHFVPITRNHSGNYTCQAKNSLGASQPIPVRLDVKFPPVIKSVGLDRLTTAMLYTQVSVLCEADGNPPPSYRWLQAISSNTSSAGGGGSEEGRWLVRSSDSLMLLRNVTYQHQGEYVCQVTNVIGGKKRQAQSHSLTIQVVGGPQVVRDEAEDVVVVRGADATLRMVVCADPRPHSAAWEWEGLQLKAGEDRGKYQAEELKQVTKTEDCYEARLFVKGAEPSDSSSYFLVAKNEKGTDRHWVKLVVHEPISLPTLIGIVCGSLFAFLLCVLCAIYCVRREKCRARSKDDYKPTDLESDRSDLESMIGRKTLSYETAAAAGAMQRNGRPQDGGPNTLLYCSSPSRMSAPPHIIMDIGKNSHTHMNTSA
ncbi:hypothetical protein LSTR_LSTR010456 [Laodelphax striatellus]|uniref:Ig-like domain-containing protein n=1 Tax=Laodelphax striatellus TaxID=195883 RepID=A0A482WW38_LAOST|nr:hypothetical protein LSTR_LSTR010456 [Laodelphax striatellus]